MRIPLAAANSQLYLAWKMPSGVSWKDWAYKDANFAQPGLPQTRAVGVFTADTGEYFEVCGGTVKLINAQKFNQCVRAALRIMVEVDGKRSARTLEELEQLLCCIYIIGNCW
jgi:hypothetical protein